mmetsp:Transcript_17823/g.27275  ORF Transcript_17823/g.27275 Transcript_17823/m.27275 type:complete len:86 (-) Transcript_17823:444-701(-)
MFNPVERKIEHTHVLAEQELASCEYAVYLVKDKHPLFAHGREHVINDSYKAAEKKIANSMIPLDALGYHAVCHITIESEGRAYRL